MNRRLVSVVVLGLVCCVALSGCGLFKKKKKPGPGEPGYGGVGPLGAEGVYVEGLSDRPEGGSEVRGQFEVVYFDYDSAQIRDSERAKIESVARGLKSTPGTIVIEGNCDERGSAEYNLSLGDRRAQSVRSYLIGLGIEGSRIQTKSYGEERPVATGHDETSWSQNRRAEFVVIQ